MHINLMRDLSLINIPQIYVDVMEERPYLQNMQGAVPTITNCVLGAFYTEIIREKLLAAVVSGKRCFGLSIGEFKRLRIATFIHNRERLHSQEELTHPPKVSVIPAPLERHYESSSVDGTLLEKMILLMNDRRDLNDVDHGEVCLERVCEDIWQHCMLGYIHFQIYVTPDLARRLYNIKSLCIDAMP